jgi:hypothetical protein
MAVAGALLAVLIATTVPAPARAIHRGYDAPFGSYRFMETIRVGAEPIDLVAGLGAVWVVRRTG